MPVPLTSMTYCCPAPPLQAVFSGTFASSSVSHFIPLIHLPALPLLTAFSPSSDFISFSQLPGPRSSPIWILHPLCREAPVPLKFILELQSGVSGWGGGGWSIGALTVSLECPLTHWGVILSGGFK